MPAGTALRCERPPTAPRSLIADYPVPDWDVAVFKGSRGWLLPGSAQLWIALTPDARAEMRSRPVDELGGGCRVLSV